MLTAIHCLLTFLFSRKCEEEQQAPAAETEAMYNIFPPRVWEPQTHVHPTHGKTCLLLTTAVSQIEQSAQCVCLSVRTITFHLNDVWHRYVACWRPQTKVFELHRCSDPECFLMGQTIQKLSLPLGGSGPHIIRGSLGGPTRVYLSIGILHGSALSAGLRNIINRQTNTQTMLLRL